MTTRATPTLPSILAQSTVFMLSRAAPKAPAFLMRPRECAMHLKNGLPARGYRLEIGWKWQGRDRAGVIFIFNHEGLCIYEDTYPRGNQRWGSGDRDMFICNHNSNKHHALIAAKDFVFRQSARRCGGISDTFISENFERGAGAKPPAPKAADSTGDLF